MRIVVFGAGSLGSLIGALLDSAHDVVLVGRDPHVSAIREQGLAVTGVEEFTASPAATTDGTELDADLAVVTVKAHDTAAAVRDLATGDVGAVVSLQNGLGNEATLAELGRPVIAGTTSHGAMLSASGVVEWTGQGDVAVGNWTDSEPAGDDPASRAAAAFRGASVDAAVDPDIDHTLWAKLAVNAAINPITALARVRNGRVFSGPTAADATRAAREVAAVARAEGIDLDPDAAVEQARTVARRTADNRSSMLQDVAAGRRTEIDAISGVVADRGADHGVDTPVNDRLCGLVRAWEVGEGLREE